MSHFKWLAWCIQVMLYVTAWNEKHACAPIDCLNDINCKECTYVYGKTNFIRGWSMWLLCFVWLTHESNRNRCLIRASNLRTCHLLNFGIWIINSNMINIPTGAGNILHWLLIRVNSGRLLYGFTDIFTVQRIISLLISIMAFH